ncbi:DNA-3-methyladenine glycosylase [Agriterribacter sp.]|uniref:DNA-3-methyladenine glycosylase n=1 Tax=Agriterribacter sp. TaxID=2821509 RepID=UPI002CCEE1E7|nr:DNA-3-methyladenine glycosylase [Agriterribacter sp.]HRO46213.1 DNA-3-methyladenine glycosylase [Agriterribacter sp.]HRQ16327.1 DNA-3-methyladenine glycosylase [Agriterribacter sp.]
MKKLDYNFYNRPNVVKIARELLGKVLVTDWGSGLTSGRIVETEAYNGITDRASHAYNGRRTARTEVMFNDAGKGYVYLCYGIHHLFNVVTNVKNTPHAILIRAVEPLQGINIMLQRTGKRNPDRTLTSGPGNVSKALGILTRHSGVNLIDNTIFIADDGFTLQQKDIIATPRIGVDYAGEDALLPYRFFIRNNIYVSGRRH